MNDALLSGRLVTNLLEVGQVFQDQAPRPEDYVAKRPRPLPIVGAEAGSVTPTSRLLGNSKAGLAEGPGSSGYMWMDLSRLSLQSFGVSGGCWQ